MTTDNVPVSANPQEEVQEEIWEAEDFTTFAKENGYRGDCIDAANGFAVFGENKPYFRNYYDFLPESGFSEMPLLEMRIFDEGVGFTKRGGAILNQESLDGEEALTITDKIIYSLRHIDGQDRDGIINNIEIGYSSTGDFEYFRGDTFNERRVSKDEILRDELDHHFGKEKTHFIKAFSSGAVASCEENGENYTFFLLGADGTPHAKINAPKAILKAEKIKGDLAVESLVKDPTQPANGYPGKSYGDKIWRDDDFSKRLGIWIEPAVE